MQIFILTALTMIAFAANSVIGRVALGATFIDPASYTLIRLVSGAVVLALLTGMNRGIPRGGNWTSAAALFGYASAFSFAYLTLSTGTGALVLFASVQLTMFAWAMYNGDQPGTFEWCGLVIAFGAFVWLVSPGLAAPDLFGSVLMAFSGISWGIYSVRGRGAADPLQATAGNFMRAVPMALVLSLLFLSSASLPAKGVILAIASGAITSGLGYALWYRVLKGLTSVQSALVQLTVPALASAGGILFLSEPLTFRFVACSALILGGIGIAVLFKTKRV